MTIRSKKLNNRIFILILFGVIFLVIIFSLSLSKQLSNNPSNNSSANLFKDVKSQGAENNKVQETFTRSDKPLNSATDTSQTASPSDQKTEEKFDQSTLNNSTSLSVVKDETKKTYTNNEQKKVEQAIGQFEDLFAQTAYSQAFEYFMKAIRDSQVEGEIRTKAPAPPHTFNIISIDVRNDSTVFAQIIETRADNLLAERYMELAPVGTDYKITRYFSKLDQSIYSGFYTDEILKQNSSNSQN